MSTETPTTSAENAEISSPSTLSMRAVTRLTGLGEHVLRAWERRHRAIVPARSDGGTRRYSQDDVHRLRLLKRCTERGQRIGEIAHLSNDELKGLCGNQADVRPSPVDPLFQPLFERTQALDGVALAEDLRRLAHLLGDKAFATEVVHPFMFEIGEAWHEGRIGVAHEHLATEAVRRTVGFRINEQRVRRGAPRLVFATPPDEKHEVGLLVATLIAATHGLKSVYLGAETPAKELCETARSVGAAAVVIAASTLDDAPLASYLTALDEGLGHATRLIASDIPEMGVRLPERCIVARDFEQFERLIRRLAPGDR